MKLAGVDLAWMLGNPSGVAFGTLKDNTLILEAINHRPYSTDALSSALKGVDAVAVDAPLIINNQEGMRDCELELSRDYGSRKASCMPTNLDKYPSHPAVNLSNKLLDLGFAHLDISQTSKWQIECYPHPAIINLFNLSERLKYKSKRGMNVNDQRKGQARLGWLIRQLSSSRDLQLKIPNHVQANSLSFDKEYSLKGKQLKAHEDKLDAIICLYIAALHAIGKTVTYGTTSNGYIVVPEGANETDKQSMDIAWNMAPWAVEMADKYCRVAESSWHIDGLVSSTNAALSLEILLKSFLLEPTSNIGKLNQRYKMSKKIGDGHDLSLLFDSLPEKIQRQLASPFEREMIARYRNFFKDSRYGYEDSATSGYSTTLHSIARAMIDKTVTLYKKRGCTDPWILSF
jgi:predicted RNase H-like nuclease